MELLRGTLLTIHLLSVVIWLGAGLYELFLYREMKLHRGKPAEVALARVYARYGPVIAGATVLVALTGVLQSSFLGWGYFQHLWLGLKQALMLGVLGVIAGLAPTFMRMGRAVASLPENTPQLSEEVRSLFSGVEPYVLVMRAAGPVAVVLAVFRPVLQ